MKVLVAAFNKEKAFSVIVQLHRLIVYTALRQGEKFVASFQLPLQPAVTVITFHPPLGATHEEHDDDALSSLQRDSNTFAELRKQSIYVELMIFPSSSTYI